MPISSSKKSLIRTIYLYLFSMVGLVLVIIGSVSFIDMGLKAFVFKKAEEQERIFFEQPPIGPAEIEKIRDATDQKKEGEQVTLSEEELTQLKNIIQTYENWEKERKSVDPVTARRHNQAAQNLAFIIVGLPLYFYHWRIIKKEV